MKRIAFDWGTARIGVAACDDTGTLAFARTWVARTGRVRDLEAVRRLVVGEEAEEIVIGLPLSEDGTEGPSALSVRAFGRRAHEACGLPVVFADERYTSVEAAESLRAMGFEPRREPGRVDAEAARLILQRYLDGLAADER